MLECVLVFRTLHKGGDSRSEECIIEKIRRAPDPEAPARLVAVLVSSHDTVGFDRVWRACRFNEQDAQKRDSILGD